jgi:glyoxylase-like metal-dependent hydrolase (beta-lactamase superfamily II)
VRIVSGGQTGADRAAWDVALELGLATGGWVPRGRRAEDGPVPERYGNLSETESEAYERRTQLNVRDSDATVVLSFGLPAGGSALTLQIARSLGRPHLHLDLDHLGIDEAVERLRDWLARTRPRVLNVAGPRASEEPRIAEATRSILATAVRQEECLGDLEVRALRLARMELPDFHPEAPGSCDIFGFLVRDGRDCVLVDTGVGSGSDLIERLYRPERVELSAALSDAGASVDQITIVVNSHLHFDHCGNNVLFPDVPIFVQEAELEAARQPTYTVPEWVDFPGASYRPIRGRHAISEHLDLVPTPGHTAGHQSLMVRSRSGLEIIVAQAAYSAAEFDRLVSADSEAPEGRWSPESYLRSLAVLQESHPRRAFFSHDLLVWEPGEPRS